MIKLTLQPDNSSTPFLFQKSTISIGSGKNHPVDLSFPNEEIKDTHVIIALEENYAIIHNISNDPFVTINGLPFGKVELHNDDLLQIGNRTIRCTLEIEEADAPIDLEALLKQVEKLDETIENAYKPSVLEIIEEDETKKTGEDKEFKETPPHYKPNPNKPRLWKWIFASLASLLLIGAVSGSIIYSKMSKESTKEQIAVAEGVSDVTMALTYAQLHHITPEKQNWFDPQFLKNNLTSILSTEYPSIGNIDNQGQFNCCNYFLRIYTSSDLSQFIVIAQPEHSILQWLLPKNAIVVDSRAMELRKVNDLKALNRLLASPTSLDNENSDEVSTLIRQGELLPLATFSIKKGLTPPKVLALIQPGAENLIYNAPRYYQFGEEILKKSVVLLQNNSNSTEVSRLQQQVAELQKLPKLVLYCSQGMQKAIEAERALKTLVPNCHFLTAYLNLDHHGTIKSSHLLLSDADQTHQKSLEIAFADPNYVLTKQTLYTPPLDRNHTLFLELQALSDERTHLLQQISDSLMLQLQKYNVHSNPPLLQELTRLTEQYQRIDKQQEAHIIAELSKIYLDNFPMPLSEFMAFIKEAGLESFNFHSISINDLSQLTTAKQVTELLEQVDSTPSFVELDKKIDQTLALLTPQHFATPQQVIAYQNQLRLHTIKQLEKFILTEDAGLSDEAFNPENREILLQLLKKIWVNHPTDQHFFLHEFDMNTPKQ